MYRIVVKLGGKVGELNLSRRDLADLCDIRPGTAGEWVSGCIERISLVDLARICQELEIGIEDVLELQTGGPVPQPDGREKRIMEKVKQLRKVRIEADRERRRFKAAEARRRIEEELIRRPRHSRSRS